MIAKLWKQSKYPQVEKKIKNVVVHIYTGINHKKEWNLTIGDSMDGCRSYQAKWNKSDRERQMPYDLTYLCNLKRKTKEQTKWNSLIQTENRLIVAKGEEDWEVKWKRWSS